MVVRRNRSKHPTAAIQPWQLVLGERTTAVSKCKTRSSRTRVRTVFHYFYSYPPLCSPQLHNNIRPLFAYYFYGKGVRRVNYRSNLTTMRGCHVGRTAPYFYSGFILVIHFFPVSHTCARRIRILCAHTSTTNVAHVVDDQGNSCAYAYWCTRPRVSARVAFIFPCAHMMLHKS
jgi:hypothetical protein